MNRGTTLLGFFLVSVALVLGCEDTPGDPRGPMPSDASTWHVDAGDAGSALTVLSTTPGPGSAGADVLSPLAVTFSEDLEPSTVTEATLTLLHGDLPVDGAVDVQGQVATFTPARRLALLGHYTATVSAGVRGASGATLASSHAWSFTTRDGAWGAGEHVHRQVEGPAASPRLALDSHGRLLAVWVQPEGRRQDLWFSRYTPGVGWEPTSAVDATLDGTSNAPELVAGADGSMVAVWVQQRGAASLMFSRYLPGQGWALPAPVDSRNGGDVTVLQLAGDDLGRVLAVWSQFDLDSFSENLWSARYTPGEGWSRAERIDIDVETFPGDTWELDVAMSGAGEAVATWSRFDGSQSTAWARHYSHGAGWSEPERLDDALADTTAPTVDVAADGTALLAWLRLEDGRQTLQGRRYVPGVGWDLPLAIDADLVGHSIDPQVRFDAAGNAVVVWSQFDGAHNSILANHYTAGAGWGQALVLETHDAGSARTPQLAVDARGHAVAVWEEEHGPLSRIAASRYVAGRGWSPATHLDTGCGGSGTRPQVALSTGGHAMAVWSSLSEGAAAVCGNAFE
ncbi:Ig-like domain-containing protein [Pyxidicoccus xibeiensis]|uniref:Ig-like domain-containing protein n=1 Tax=Pyxidicoccus xibeiensis TaxID=2906759 RepID=UPI0020A6FF89|nr:Ig-like domain-containing protein [Pyxidicoccus xibeiensis]MCP3144119.1 Ig-like domain-containing protein [Pyxidicoccus xibeiensis]